MVSLCHGMSAEMASLGLKDALSGWQVHAGCQPGVRLRPKATVPFLLHIITGCLGLLTL